MPFVLDASTTLTWCFEDQSNDYSRAVLTALQGDNAYVPALWELEVLNALLGAERKKLLSHAECLNFLYVVNSLSIKLYEGLVKPLELYALALDYRLSAYDATYLELAIRLGLPLASLDKKILQAARQAGVKIFQS
jgi:predicted nucleic acid-binding protein